MQTYSVTDAPDWRVVGSASGAQAALMTLEAGNSTGGDDNRHEKSEQWLLVLEGKGTAWVEGKKVSLLPGVMLCIEKGEAHRVEASAELKLKTLNFYAPPAYET